MIERILLDMDGVLVDFVKGACEFHGKTYPYGTGKQAPWDLEPIFQMTAPELWDPLGYEFWKNLEPYPHMEEFVGLLESKFGEEHICLLTSPVRTKGCIEGKMDWIRHYLPQYRRRFLVGPAKEFCASEKHALVDDHQVNIDKFIDAGGHTFLVPAAWNRRFNEEPLEALKTWLDSI